MIRHRSRRLARRRRVETPPVVKQLRISPVSTIRSARFRHSITQSMSAASRYRSVSYSGAIDRRTIKDWWHTTIPRSSDRQVSPRFGSRFFLTQRLMYQNYILNASMAVFRKDAIPKEREYASYRYVGDWLFWLGVTMNGDVAYIDKPLDGFRQHGDNTTAKSTRGGRNFDEIQRILRYMLPRLGMPAGYAAFMYGKFFIRINRHKRSNPDFNDVYRRWTADAPHPRLCIMWYRVAKLLGIYKHSH